MSARWRPEYSVRLDRTVGRAVYALHRWVYEGSGGRVGASSPLGPVLLLSTTGRRTGRRRTKPLLYLDDGERFVVVASNAGRPRNPDWWHNLRAHPDAEVRAGRRVALVRGREATPEEAAGLWPRLHAMYDGFAHYATLTARPFPVVVLERAPSA